MSIMKKCKLQALEIIYNTSISLKYELLGSHSRAPHRSRESKRDREQIDGQKQGIIPSRKGNGIACEVYRIVKVSQP